MTKHIDYAAKADEILARYEDSTIHMGEAGIAQAYALRALVEEQKEANKQARIANLIAYHNSISEEWNGATWDEKVIDPIREGLGL